MSRLRSVTENAWRRARAAEAHAVRAAQRELDAYHDGRPAECRRLQRVERRLRSEAEGWRRLAKSLEKLAQQPHTDVTARRRKTHA